MYKQALINIISNAADEIIKNDSENNLAVYNKPKSAIAEAFRAISSSLQFMYKKHDFAGRKTVMVTSSVSGEGKTFCSINIATVFALSRKKTVLVGLDLRKPKIFGDFDIDNTTGAVNYLIGQKSLQEVVQHTKVENLDVITSGPIPPNPSELLIGSQMDQFIAELKSVSDLLNKQGDEFLNKIHNKKVAVNLKIDQAAFVLETDSKGEVSYKGREGGKKIDLIKRLGVDLFEPIIQHLEIENSIK